MATQFIKVCPDRGCTDHFSKVYEAVLKYTLCVPADVLVMAIVAIGIHQVEYQFMLCYFRLTFTAPAILVQLLTHKTAITQATIHT